MTAYAKSLGLACLAALFVFACARGLPLGLPLAHPDAGLGEQRPMCTGCHPGADAYLSYRRYDHTPAFAENHRLAVRVRPETCRMCHADSWCSQCHGLDQELTPSQKHPHQVWRRNPHRGNYLTRHRVEGGVNPAGCYKCHGNPESSETCVRCHG
ncbi:MAG: cytochrome C [Deltaproteobacteria bacterium]|nr:cytochrome C [Deltaproteobacteria bacterium]